MGNQLSAHIERPLRDLGELLVFGRISPSLFGLARAAVRTVPNERNVAPGYPEATRRWFD